MKELKVDSRYILKARISIILLRINTRMTNTTGLIVTRTDNSNVRAKRHL